VSPIAQNSAPFRGDLVSLVPFCNQWKYEKVAFAPLPPRRKRFDCQQGVKQNILTHFPYNMALPVKGERLVAEITGVSCDFIDAVYFLSFPRTPSPREFVLLISFFLVLHTIRLPLSWVYKQPEAARCGQRRLETESILCTALITTLTNRTWHGTNLLFCDALLAPERTTAFQKQSGAAVHNFSMLGEREGCLFTDDFPRSTGILRGL
jgi:hypothetical protein